MTRDQYKRAKEIEAELRQVQERIKDIEWILDRGVTNVGVMAVDTSMYCEIYPKHETLMDFLKLVRVEYVDRIKKLEEEFNSL